MKTILLTVLLLAAVSISMSAKTAAQPAPTQTPAKAEQANPGSAPAKGNPTLQSLITVADVEKVGGFTGIKQVIEGDRVNFSTQDNKMVLKVQVHSHFGDRLYKETKSTQLNFHASVSGIGDDAFDGPSDNINMGVSSADGKKQPYLLWFLKGSTSVSLTTYADSRHPQFYLSQDKLRELAKIMASRL
jgi:hypothetical protein